MQRASSLTVIFTTVLIDLIGFGMVIPLVSLYGRHYGAAGIYLPLLGGIFSLMQFFFAPFWGRISDRVGRRPILLLSLLGSTLSYLLFGLAPNLTCLLLARAVGGVFAANISTAQAYIADITSPQERTKGMGLIGAAFGIGFTLGPPLGGLSSQWLGLKAPGLIASLICGLNFLLAIFRLPETLPAEARKTNRLERSWLPVTYQQCSDAMSNPTLRLFLVLYFMITFGFSNMEQTFSLLFHERLGFPLLEAGLKTGLVLMTSGLVGAILQGLLIQRLVRRLGELRLLVAGLLCNFFTMILFPYGAHYLFYFILAVPLACGSAFINPSLSSLISQHAPKKRQGSTLGFAQSLGSLARATGPIFGLTTFQMSFALPFITASCIALGCFLGVMLHQRKYPSLKASC